MKIDILTLFPEMFSPLNIRLSERRVKKDFSRSTTIISVKMRRKARHVDDETLWWGKGCSLRAQPIFDAFDAIEKRIRA